MKILAATKKVTTAVLAVVLFVPKTLWEVCLLLTNGEDESTGGFE